MTTVGRIAFAVILAFVLAVIVMVTVITAVAVIVLVASPCSWGRTPATLVIIVRIAAADIPRRDPHLAGSGRCLPMARNPLVILYAAVIHVVAGNPYNSAPGRFDNDFAARRWRTKVNTEMNLRERRRCKGHKARKHYRLNYIMHDWSFFPHALSNKLSN